MNDVAICVIWLIFIGGLGAVSALGTYLGLRMYAEYEEKRKSATK